MNINKTGYTVLVSAITAIISSQAIATNGMNLEGYGPVAGAMGGASMATDNGTAAVMNNPATLGLQQDNARMDLALGKLGPDVTSKFTGMPDAKSSGDAYYMPAIGYTRKYGQFVYGVGVFAQGGMGTEYDSDSFVAAGSGDAARSEVSVGRFVIPLAYNVNEQLTVAGSLDYVWAGMDIKMAMSGGQFGDMVAAMGGSQTNGTASGGMVTGLGAMVAGGDLQPPGTGSGPVNWARFDFSNNSDFTGEASGTGFAAKLGAVFQVSRQLKVGATYHAKTALGDLETDSATVTMNANMNDGVGGFTNVQTIPVKGKISVKDFQWPAMIGIGAAFQVNDKLMVAADVKQLQWSSVMKDFSMTFDADATQAGFAAGFAGSSMDVSLLQKWKDQTIINLGAAYMVNPRFRSYIAISSTSS